MKGKKKLLSALVVSLIVALLFFIPAMATPQNAEAATTSNVGTTPTEVKVTGVTLNKTSLTLNLGASQSITATVKPNNATKKTVSWVSSNTKVATVSKGTIKAVGVGTATITVKTANGKTATCKVTVKNEATGVTLNKTNLTLVKGESQTITATIKPYDTTTTKTLTWTSSNTKVATVSGGRITAKNVGTATITVKTANGKVATCKVTVTDGRYISTTEAYNTVNTYRKKYNVKYLLKDANLENLAKTRARELVTKFSHTRPNGQSGLKIIPGNLYKGENIAKGQKTVAAVCTAWYNSAGHRANMLNINYRKIGIAGYEYNGVIYWVQLFSS